MAVLLAALFLVFSTGTAVAPECHLGSLVPKSIQNEVVQSNSGHQGHSHSHSHLLNSSAALNSQAAFLLSDSVLNSEICVVVGFIVLLLLRFSFASKLNFKRKQYSLPRYQLPLILSKNLGYLNRTHLRLGVIRI
ncbi:MAG: hypothetical protein RL193_1121 [Actinomycetota bacterium]